MSYEDNILLKLHRQYSENEAIDLFRERNKALQRQILELEKKLSQREIKNQWMKQLTDLEVKNKKLITRNKELREMLEQAEKWNKQ